MSVIQVEHLEKKYGRFRGIEDLVFEVRPGEVYGFLGPNGSGKTTTIRTLLGMLKPTAGRASILGLDIQRDSVRIRQKVGYLPGELNLYPEMTALEVLRYFADLRGMKLGKEVHDTIEKLKLDPRKRIRDLSKGNKQKIGIIQAFMHHPEVLILDEPTSGLDPLMQYEFDQLILEAKKQGKSVLLSSHVLGEVDKTADRVGILKEGRLIVQSTMQELKCHATQQIEVEFVTAPSQEALVNIPGITDTQVQGNRAIFTVSGKMDSFIKTLSRFEILSLRSLSADLESLFMDYYREDSHAQRV
ncbi:ABC transporter ATP-binding protein [Deinococcus cellulosilyticus]|uniref:ABC transporter ATP-binding protein n=1 Tax=Deinococcus cellulosilyticus (strain DSM 18568 / NBRC 106333 / KACC 11606 / 5516J-15) TaxID=1223518 RepID=A0A511MY87_DEIC1|nr:ABC transporter ATP-binding protein [Deinococcus cellulosilyticus]GEM45097.1 ABC transporter ATP-binding protein [Deinococcus cellulosilyticus NBRC 106333 = KACC 11606]